MVMKKLFNDALFIINGDDFSVRSESPMPKWSVSFRKPCSPGNDKKKKTVSKKRVLVLCQQWSGAKWCLIIKIVKFTVFHFFFSNIYVLNLTERCMCFGKLKMWTPFERYIFLTESKPWWGLGSERHHVGSQSKSHYNSVL